MGRRGRTGMASAMTAVAVALATAACGSGTLAPQASRQGPQGVLAAVSAAEHATSYRFSLFLSLDGFGTAMAALGDTGSGSSANFSESGSGAFSAADDAVSEQMTTSSGPGTKAVEVRVIAFLRSGVAYLSVSQKSAKPWEKVSGSALSGLGGSASLTPADFLQGIAAYVASEKSLGPATIDGVATTQYSLTIRIKQVMQKLEGGGVLSGLLKMFSGGSSAGGLGQSVVQAALNSLPTTVEYLAYVDHQGRLRRMVVGLPIGSMMVGMFTALAKSGAVGTSGQGLTQTQIGQVEQAFSGVSETVSMDLWDYGSPVHIAAPPASQVSQGSGSGLLGLSGVS